MSDQSSYFVPTLGSDSFATLRDRVEAALGKARAVTAVHYSSGPQTLAGASDFVTCDTTSAGFTVNLPASPLAGDTYVIVKTVAGNTLTIGRNGKTINGAAADDTLTTAYQWKAYTWSAAANTWLMRS